MVIRLIDKPTGRRGIEAPPDGRPVLHLVAGTINGAVGDRVNSVRIGRGRLAGESKDGTALGLPVDPEVSERALGEFSSCSSSSSVRARGERKAPYAVGIGSSCIAPPVLVDQG